MPTTTEKLKVQARNLQKGDVVNSGEIVVSVSAGVRTPRGKVEVTLEKADGIRAGQRRTSLWGASTEINVTRTPAPATANDNRPTRLDIVTNGVVNTAIFETVLASRIEAEINLQLCGAAGLHAPNTLRLGEVEGWRAACVERFGLGPITDAAREKIEAHERSELNGWVRAWQRGAALQRQAMGAVLQAAE